MAFSSQTFTIPYVVGVNESSGEVNVNPYLASYAQNIHTTYGVLETARGYREYISTPLPARPTRIYLFSDVDTAAGTRTRHVIVTTEDQVLVWDEAASAWKVLMDGALSGDWGFITYQKDDDVILILGNGKDPVKVWDGVADALSDLEGAPCRGRFFALHYERLWMGGDPALPNSVFYSRQFNPNDWTGDLATPSAGGGQVDLPSFESGGFITGIYTSGNEIIVMKESTAIRIYGTSPSSYTAYEITGGIGTRAERAIVPFAGANYFLTRHGLGVQSGSAVSLLGDRAIPRIFDGMYVYGQALRLAADYPDKACGTRFDSKIWIAVPLGESAENNALLEYDPNRESMMLHRGINVIDWADGSQEDEYVIFAGANAAGEYRVYAYGDSVDYDGAPQQSVWESPWQDFGDKGRRKFIRQARLYGSIEKAVEALPDSPRVSVTVETDRGRFCHDIEPFPFRPQPQSYRFGLRLMGERFRVVIEAQANARFRFTGGVELEVEQE